MIIPNASGNAGDTVQVSVEINNANEFTAFQLSLKLHAQLTYLSGSAALAGRESDHTLSAGMVSGDSLRIVSYSDTKAAYSGSSGSVVTFNLILGSVPGSYALNPKNVIIADASSNNILTGVTNGQMTLYAPKINLSTTALNYTRTIVGNYRDMTFTIYNNGNATLTIDSLVVSPSTGYIVVAGWSSTVSASGSQVITVRFTPPSRGSFVGTVKVYSDDPDEPYLVINLSGTGYKVNELHVNNLSTRSGTDTTLTFKINNQEPFTGFQFDLALPSSMTYLSGTEQLTGRATDHSVSANVISGNKLRVVAYSNNQSNFSGSDGNVVQIGIHVEGTGGSYSLNLSNVIITGSAGENILSDSYNGQLTIAAGDIQSTTSINYGTISIFETADLNLTIQNVGNDTLVISSFTSNETLFTADVSLPIKINPSQQAVLSTHFHSDVQGSYSGKYTLRSNDPDEEPYYVSFSGTSYSPNTMEVQDAIAINGDYVSIYVDINNNDSFTAFQLDLVLPSQLAVILDSCKLTDRNQSHSLSKGLISGNTYRFFAYSNDQNLFTGTSGAVLRVLCSVSGSSGTYPMNIQNPIIGNASGQDILSSSGNGSFYLLAQYSDTQAAALGVTLHFNVGSNGRHIDMVFNSLTGSGNVTVQQTNTPPSNAPCINVCGFLWTISVDAGITAFSVDITFHYTNADATGYTKSVAFFGIAKYNSSTNTWQWLGGTVDAANNTITVSGITSFSTFALFRRIFGDITGDGYVDAADLQRLGDCWHATNSGEFTGGSDARFFNYNKNTDGGDQIIDAADLQVFGDCWHNGVPGLLLKSIPSENKNQRILK